MKKLLLLLGITFGIFADSGTWQGPVSGDWEVDANWTGATYPQAAGETATFPNADNSVGTTSSITVGEIAIESIFPNPTLISLSDMHDFIFDNGVSPAEISFAPNSILTLILDISLGNSIQIPGAGLNFTGSGSAVLNAQITGTGDISLNNGTTVLFTDVILPTALSAYGDTFINEGILAVTFNAIPAGSTVTVGDGIGTSAELVLDGFTMAPANAFHLLINSDGVLVSNSDGAETYIFSSLNGSGQILLNTDSSDTVRFQVATTGNDIFSGTISGGDADSSTSLSGNTFEMTGTGRLTLSGNNTYLTRTFVHPNGTIRLASNTALGSSAADTDAFALSGGTFEFIGGITVDKVFHIEGTGVGGNGALRNITGDNAILGNVELTADATIGVDDDDLTISGQITGTGNLTKVGTDDLILSNGSNSYGLTTTVSAGGLETQADGAIPAGSSVTVAAGAELDLEMHSITMPNAYNVTVNGTLDTDGPGADDLTFRFLTIGGTGEIELNEEVNDENIRFQVVGPSDSTFSGLISKGKADSSTDPSMGDTFEKMGNSRLTLSGANTYLTRTFVHSGSQIQLQSNTALGSSAANTDAFALPGGAFEFAGGITVDKVFHINGDGVGSTGALLNVSGVNTISGNVIVESDASIGATADTLNISGIVSGASHLTKVGAGTLEYSGALPNTLTGTTTISEGTLDLNKTPNMDAIVGPLMIDGGTVLLSQANQIGNSSDVTLNAGGTFDMGGNSDTIGSFNYVSGTFTPGGATLSLNSAGTALTMTAGLSLTNPIVMTNGAGKAIEITGTGTSTISDLDLGDTLRNITVPTGVTLDLTTSVGTGFNKLGGGDLILSGTHNYGSNPSTISAGTLSLAGATFTTSPLNINLGGAPLINTANSMITGNIAINTDTSINVNVSTVLAIDGGLVGGSNFEKIGDGTLSLTGNVASTLTGTTTVSAGTLELNKTAGTDAIVGPLNIDTGSVVLLQANQIGSSSDVTLNAGGTFDMGGNADTIRSFNYVAGTFTPGGATLSLNSAGTALTMTAGLSLTNPIVMTNGAGKAIEITGTGTSTISDLDLGDTLRNITVPTGVTLDLITSVGTGFNKLGGGDLHLVGTQNYGVNPSFLSAGKLDVDGTLTTSPLTISPGATLLGTGTIEGNVNNGGTIAAGGSIGQLTVVGTVNFDASSIFEAELNTAVSDLLLVLNGDVNISDGATLSILPEPGEFGDEFLYTIISTPDGMVNGEFTNVTSPLPLFLDVVTYLPDAVLLLLEKIDFTEVITKGNGAQVAKCLDSFDPPEGSDLAFILELFQETPTIPALVRAIDQIQPSQLKGLALSQENNAFLFRQAIEDRIYYYNRQICSCCEEDCCCNMGLWISAGWDNYEQRKENNQVGFNADTAYGILGFDFENCCNFLFGVSGGYSYSKLAWQENRGLGRIHSGYGSLYGNWLCDCFFADAVVLGAYNSYDEKRDLKFFGLKRSAEGYFNGWEVLGHLGLGGIFTCCDIEIRPFVSADYLYMCQDSFKERGAKSLNLVVESSDYSMVRAEGGFLFGYCCCTEWGFLDFDLKLSYVREERFEGESYKAKLRDTDCTFKVKGLNPDRNIFAPGAALRFHVPCDCLSYGFHYDGEFADHYRNHNFRFSLEYTF